MTVYVDDMLVEKRLSRLLTRWSHLFADSTKELDDFALRLGMKIKWRQKTGTYHEHYDVSEVKRTLAVELGAVEIDYPRGTGRLLMERRLLELMTEEVSDDPDPAGRDPYPGRGAGRCIL